MIEQRTDHSIADRLAANGLRQIGRLKPRQAREIADSPWSIGCETIDRGYVDFAHTGPHLADLGAKHARIQAGWARCDPRGDGAFEWQWLDQIVKGCLNQGVHPWLETSYGNPAIEGGGGIGLAEGIPTSAAALAAWDRWVAALVDRYKGRASAYEIWNEPDNQSLVSPSPQAYGDFFIRTATIVRRHDPAARIIAFGLASHLEFAESALATIVQGGGGGLVDEITFHTYPHNPDDRFDKFEQLLQIARKYVPHARLWQGETGAPSETQRFMALGQHDWNERKQAVWNLRRLLAHHVRGFAMNLFQLADMQYTKASGARFEGRNPKGLLHVQADKTVAYRKPSYTAAQSVYSIFDNRFPLVPLRPLAVEAPFKVDAYAWTCEKADQPAIVGWWRSDEPPALETPEVSMIPRPGNAIDRAVLVDLLSGSVFDPPTGDAVPCIDSPLLLADAALLQFVPLERP